MKLIKFIKKEEESFILIEISGKKLRHAVRYARGTSPSTKHRKNCRAIVKCLCYVHSYSRVKRTVDTAQGKIYFLNVTHANVV